MKEIYVKPTAQSIDLEITSILLASGAELALEENDVNVSGLSRFVWNDMMSTD